MSSIKALTCTAARLPSLLPSLTTTDMTLVSVKNQGRGGRIVLLQTGQLDSELEVEEVLNGLHTLDRVEEVLDGLLHHDPLLGQVGHVSHTVGGQQLLWSMVNLLYCTLTTVPGGCTSSWPHIHT